MTLREMRPEEARGLQLRAMKNFIRALEAPFVTKPKEAMVAEQDGEIIGGFIYSIEESKKCKLGFIDFFFVENRYMGRGLGRALCRAGVAHLWAKGCDYLGAVVRDDNVGSWAAFERNGFIRVGLLAYAKAVGLVNFMKTNLIHGYGFSPGCNLYFATRPEKETNPGLYIKKFGVKQLITHLVFNSLLVFIIFILNYFNANRINTNYYEFLYVLQKWLLSGAVIFGGIIFITYMGTFFSRRKWRYQLTTGGGLLGLLVSLAGGVLPLMGNFYPEKYENTKKFRRDMAITAMLPWLLLMAALRVLPGLDVEFLHTGFMNVMVQILLVMRCIPLFAVNLGSSRVYKYNKILWLVMVGISVAMLVK